MTYAYEAFFCAGYAAFYKDVGSFQLAIADVTAFNGDFFAVFADFEDAFVVFGSLVIAHLTRARNRVHDVMGVPWT